MIEDGEVVRGARKRAKAGAARSPAPKQRRTHAERSAETRARTIAAARDLLYLEGYSGATTLAIRAASGISSGAIQHQFPTKAKLMAAVVAEGADWRTDLYREAIRRGKTPRESLLNLVEAGFESARTPQAIATMEIALARRSDPELARETAPILQRFNRRVRLWGHLIRKAAGLPHNDLFRILNNAIIRGLALESITEPDQPIDDAMTIWKQHYLAMVFGENPNTIDS